MATFSEHIKQAKNNLNFLHAVNKNISNYWDWQVTVSFYVAVHLVNAHIAAKINQHYRTHGDVNNALNPYNTLSPAKLDEQLYTSYIKLQGLARRSRYLCHDNSKNKDTSTYFTYDKHFSKALKNLDRIIKFISKNYSVNFDPVSIKCIELKGYKSENFILE